MADRRVRIMTDQWGAGTDGAPAFMKDQVLAINDDDPKAPLYVLEGDEEADPAPFPYDLAWATSQGVALEIEEEPRPRRTARRAPRSTARSAPKAPPADAPADESDDASEDASDASTDADTPAT